MHSIYSGYYSLQGCIWVDNMDFEGVRSPLCATTNVQRISDPTHVELEIGRNRVDEILSMVQPTEVSDKKRMAIIEYIQRLANMTYGIEVIPFGSVPLKTYLPEGDIDLAAMCPFDDEVMARLILNLLEHEYKSNTEFEVRDVKYIPAQVKVVRCSVKNVAVDISFNQTAGLWALIFFQKVNSIIGRDHLFKRSVILIKAWCFYESRILGANHGLISTYALQTMIAHIINLFHSSLHSPIAVLYRFLKYYSSFNWEMHYVAINGLVLISKFPEVVVQRPDDCDVDVIITDDYLSSCREKYNPIGMSKNREKVFRTKFLNVMDPLLEDNNLGKSISRGNFKRIMAAFSYGYESLRDTFTLPREYLTTGIDNFFHTVIYNNARSSTTIHVSSTDTEHCTDKGSHLSSKKETDCSSSGISITKICSPNSSSEPQMTMLINPAILTMTSPKAKEAVVGMNEESQSSKEIVEAKPALLVNMKELSVSPSNDESSGVQNEPLSSPSKLFSKDTGGSEGKNQGAWNKPLVWSTEERKGAALKINPTSESLSSDMSKEVVASLESSVCNSSIPMPTKVEDNQPSQSSVQNHQEVVEAKPALSIDMKEFPSFPIHVQRSVVQHKPHCSTSRPSKKVLDGSEVKGKGAWNKPLIWKQVEKGTEQEKVIDCGAWKVPLAPKLLAKVGDCSKDESVCVRKSTTGQIPAQKGTNRSDDKTAPRK